MVETPPSSTTPARPVSSTLGSASLRELEEKEEKDAEVMETVEVEEEPEQPEGKQSKLMESKPKVKPAPKPMPATLWTPPACPHCSNPVKKFVTDVKGWTCSECGRELDRGVALNGCRQCNYDICTVCAGGPPVEVTAVPRDQSKPRKCKYCEKQLTSWTVEEDEGFRCSWCNHLSLKGSEHYWCRRHRSMTMCANCANAPGAQPRTDESIREAREFTMKEKEAHQRQHPRRRGRARSLRVNFLEGGIEVREILSTKEKNDSSCLLRMLSMMSGKRPLQSPSVFEKHETLGSQARLRRMIRCGEIGVHRKPSRGTSFEKEEKELKVKITHGDPLEKEEKEPKVKIAHGDPFEKEEKEPKMKIAHGDPGGVGWIMRMPRTLQ